jgi:hypothetical protein
VARNEHIASLDERPLGFGQHIVYQRFFQAIGRAARIEAVLQAAVRFVVEAGHD